MSRLKKDGTPDMRYSCNRSAYLPPGRNVGGGYDMRSSVNRQLFNEPRQMTGGPTRMDGKPDMRYKVNKEAAKTKVVYSPPVASMKVTVPHVGPIRRDGHPDMRYSENRAHLPSNPLTKGPTNVDGTLDMRYTVTKKAVDAKVILPPQAEKVTPTGPTSKKGQPDMRYHENRAHLPSGPLTKGPTNVDGTLDMRYTVNKKAVDAKARRALYPKLDIEDDFYERAKEDAIPVMRIPLREDYQDEYEDDYDSDEYYDDHDHDDHDHDDDDHLASSDTSEENIPAMRKLQTKTEFINEDGNSEYIRVWYSKRIGIEQKTVCNKLACAEIDEVKLHVNIERDNYEPIESGWRVTQVNVGDNVMVTWSDYSPKFPSLERHILQGEEIVYGPDVIHGRVKESAEYIIGCIAYHHGDITQYTWYHNDKKWKSGKNLSVVHVPEEGTYWCRVCYFGKEEDSSKIRIISIVDTPADIKLKKEDLTFEEEIGAGTFGTVWKGKWMCVPVSIKVVPGVLTNVPKEVNLCRKLRHPNILSLIGVVLTKVKFYLVNQYVNGYDLQELLHILPKESQLKYSANGYVIYQIAIGLQYLHGNGIVHMDLKPANVLVECGTNKTFICDFGLSEQREKTSSYMQSTETGSSLKGTIAFCSKERLEGSSMKSRPCVDVYGFGCIINEVYSRKRVWEGLGLPEIMLKIMMGKFPNSQSIANENVRALLNRVFVPAESRPTICDLLPELKGLVHPKYASWV